MTKQLRKYIQQKNKLTSQQPPLRKTWDHLHKFLATLLWFIHLSYLPEKFTEQMKQKRKKKKKKETTQSHEFLTKANLKL